MLCTAVLFSIEAKLGFIKIETPLEWLIPPFNIFLAIYVWQNRKRFTSYFKHPVILGTIALGVSMTISALHSEVPTHSFKGLLLWFNYVFAFLIGFIAIDFTTKEQKNFLLWCGISYGILLIYAFANYLKIGINYHHSYKMALPFANGHTLLIAMAFPLWLYITSICIKKPIQDKSLTLFWVFYTLVIYLSYSRFYWVFATFCIIAIFLYYYPRWLKVTLLSILLLCIGVYIAYIKISEYRNKHQVWLDPKDHTTAFVQIESIFVLSKNESNLERKNRWKAAKLMFEENTWTGIGINTFPERYNAYRDKLEQDKIARTTRYNDYMNAHSLYIGTMSEQGIIGIIALLGFMISCLYFLRKWTIVGILIFVHYVLLGVIEDFTLLVEIIPCFWICVAYAIKQTS
ncbi:MAG: O-antigen ligase family protein [Bacteroidia bacterium]|nr:O-antigen ligase family protein [Bacteroidia bacterium]